MTTLPSRQASRARTRAGGDVRERRGRRRTRPTSEGRVTPRTPTNDASPAPFATRSGPGGVPASTGLLVQLGALRFVAGQADVLAAVTVEWFDKRHWGDA